MPIVNTVNAESLSASCSVTADSADTATWVASVSGGSGSVSYSWSGTDGLSDSTATTTKTYATSGTKVGTVTISSGSSSSSATCSIVMTVSSSPACSDGIDNDGDGDFDYPDDIGCSSDTDTDESNTPLAGTCSVDLTTADTGDTVTWTAVPVGGVSPYTFTWSGTDGLSGSATTTTKSYSSAGTKTASTTIVSGTESEIISCSNSATISAVNTAPVITLLGTTPTTLTVGSTYTDAGATAADIEDGDITSSIVTLSTVSTTTAGTYTVSYNVTDSEGLSATEVVRTVIVATSPQCSDSADNDGDGLTDEDDPACHTDGDATNTASYDASIDDENSIPVITLIDGDISLTTGDTFTDPGQTAADEEDGDITSSVVVAGDTVDTATAGTYTITYNVSDSKGAAAVEVTRTITVTDPTPSTPPSTPAPSGGGGGGGGGPRIRLEISNEKVERLATSTALVTWDTNLQAQSQVFYGKTSYASSTLPFSEYATSTTMTDLSVTKHSVVVSGLEHGMPYFFRPTATRSDEEKGGIELTLTLEGEVAIVAPAICSEYLLEPIKFGEDNNPIEVTKLQIFLNEFEGFDLDVTGFYNLDTFEAVEVFQEKYADDILTPWGIEGSTGYVYITTMKKINEIYCNRFIDFNINDVEKEIDRDEIIEFKALLESLRERGLPLPDTSKVGFFKAPIDTGITAPDTSTSLAVDSTDASDGIAEGLAIDISGAITTQPDSADSVSTDSATTESVDSGGIFSGRAGTLASVIRSTEIGEDNKPSVFRSLINDFSIGNIFNILFRLVF